MVQSTILSEAERLAAWAAAADTMRHILSADTYEPNEDHEADHEDRRERRRARRSSWSAPDNDDDFMIGADLLQEQAQASNSTLPSEREANHQSGNGTDGQQRFDAFVKRQEELKNLDPDEDRLTRKNCTTLETFETLSERRMLPNPPEDQTCWFAMLGGDIVESIVLAIVSGERTRSSDEKMLRRLAQQMCVYGKAVYADLRHSASFWRSATTLICLVHRSNQILLSQIMGVRPPDFHRKHSEVFGLKWKCVGTSLPRAGSDGKPPEKVQRFGRRDMRFGSHRAALVPAHVSNHAPDGDIIESFLEDKLKATGEGVVDFTKLDAITLPLRMIMTENRHGGTDHSVPIFRLRSHSYVKVKARSQGTHIVRPALYFMPVDEGEKTIDQMDLTIPPVVNRDPNANADNELAPDPNTWPRRYRMPETFDFMLRYAIRVQNERCRLHWQKRYRKWLHKQWPALCDEEKYDFKILWLHKDRLPVFVDEQRGGTVFVDGQRVATNTDHNQRVEGLWENALFENSLGHLADACTQIGMDKPWFVKPPEPDHRSLAESGAFPNMLASITAHKVQTQKAYVEAARAFLDDGAKTFYMAKHPLPPDVPEDDKDAWAEVLRVRTERLNERTTRKRRRGLAA